MSSITKTVFAVAAVLSTWGAAVPRGQASGPHAQFVVGRELAAAVNLHPKNLKLDGELFIAE